MSKRKDPTTRCDRCGNMRFLHDKDFRRIPIKPGCKTVETQYGTGHKFVFRCD